MSAIGTYNLELTEAANELGFNSLSEAFEAGFVPEGEKLVPGTELAKEVEAGHRQAELLKYSNNQLKDELERRIRDKDRRAPMED